MATGDYVPSALRRFPPRARALVALIVSIPLAVGIHLAFLAWSPLRIEFQESTSWRLAADLASAALATIALVLLLLWGVRGRGGTGATVATWFRPGRWRGLVLGLALTLPIPLARVLVHQPGALTRPSTDGLPLLLVVTLPGPLWEELLFRGFLFGVLVREVRLNPWAALLLTSALFGFGHLSPDGPLSAVGGATVLYTGCVGVFLCWACWRRGEDLWFPVGFHAGLNLWSLLFQVPPGESDVHFTLTARIAPILTMGAAYVVLRLIEERKARPTH